LEISLTEKNINKYRFGWNFQIEATSNKTFHEQNIIKINPYEKDVILYSEIDKKDT